MSKFSKSFLLGASTAAHQVEGNNVHSDFWAMEQMKNSSFDEPSLDAADHYHRFEEDIKLMAKAGLNAYRFSIEWARIEPEKGKYQDQEIEHYRKVLVCCHENGIQPIVTMHHFSSPKWLIEEGGWESEKVIPAFAGYCRYVVEKLGPLMEYVCTINEANMGLQLTAMVKEFMQQMHQAETSVQVGMNVENSLEEKVRAQAEENRKVFGTEDPQSFLSMRTKRGDQIIMRAHREAEKAMKEACPHLKIGITLSLFDLQAEEDEGRKLAQREWEEDFLHYLPYMQEDDFFGLQNYTRKCFGPAGVLAMPEGAKLTQMGYENYPHALENVIRAVHKDLKLPILITENGIATDHDKDRIAFIEEALHGVHRCMEDGIEILGYMHWSLIDNFEWQKGFSRTFGLVAFDRKTKERFPKESLYTLGSYLCRR